MYDSNNQCTRYLLNIALTCAQAMPYRDTLTWLGREENSSIIMVSSPSVSRNVCDLFKARAQTRKTNHLNAGSILVQRPRHFIKRQVMSMLHNVSGAGPTRGQCWLSATPPPPSPGRTPTYPSIARPRDVVKVLVAQMTDWRQNGCKDCSFMSPDYLLVSNQSTLYVPRPLYLTTGWQPGLSLSAKHGYKR